MRYSCKLSLLQVASLWPLAEATQVDHLQTNYGVATYVEMWADLQSLNDLCRDGCILPDTPANARQHK